MLKDRCIPASYHTASEPQERNSLPGAPVKASMSGNAEHCNQGGTVEYISYPTPDFVRGWVFFIPSPMGNE
jgi:hypothetical protein